MTAAEMVMAQPIDPSNETGITTLSGAISDALLRLEAIKCEKCGRRPRAVIARQERKWCSVCIEGYRRQSSPDSDILTCGGLIPARYVRATLDDLAGELAEKYRALPDDVGMMLWGAPGTGKTHSMCAFGRDLWAAGWDVRRTTYESLMLQIRDTYKPGSVQTELGIVKPLMEAGKLIIEDIGTTVAVGTQESDFSLRTLLVLLDHRLEHCRATYITSNKCLEELGKSFDARIASRIAQACEVVRLTGKDRRTGQ